MTTTTTTYEKIQAHQLAGTAGSHGIERQLWETPSGVREQYAVTVPRPLPRNKCASERTVHVTEAAARVVWDARASEPDPGFLWIHGRMSLSWERTAARGSFTDDELAEMAQASARRAASPFAPPTETVAERIRRRGKE